MKLFYEYRLIFLGELKDMSKTVKKTTEELPKYVRRLAGGTYEARKMIHGRTIRVSGKNLTEVMLEFEFKIR